MSLDTYANLQTEIGEWLNRTDLSAKIPTFIQLAEVEMKRRLRHRVTRANLTIAARNVTIPSGASVLLSINLSTGSPSQDVPLMVGTMSQLAEFRARFGDTTARPQMAAIAGTEILFAPAPDQSYTAEITYVAKLTPLSTTNTTNNELTNAPDLYLFGALKNAEPYVENDDRLIWEKRFDNAIDQLNTQRADEEFSLSLRPVRLPIVFGG